ncbi:MAG: M48 family metallopeptidase [Alphaproteobacteria bacterium]|nr:M48 family metallopeptidase [Alphaproteobacteria bacterium]
MARDVDGGTAAGADGLYNDGRTARAHIVRVRIAGDRLEIVSAAGEEIALWPLAEIRRVPEERSDPAVLRLWRPGEDARLTLSDPAFMRALYAAAPHLVPRRTTRIGLLLRSVGLAAASAGFLAGIYFGLPLVAEPFATHLPYGIERRIGENLVEQDAMVRPPCDAPEGEAGRAALQALADRLAPPDWPHPIRTRIVYGDGFENAYALPGGTVVFTAEMIDFLADPDEVAHVLAHEIGHVVRRHVLAAMVEQMGLVVLLESLAGGTGGVAGVILPQSSMLIGLSYSREAEREADALAIAYLTRNGYSPLGGARMFERLLARTRMETERSPEEIEAAEETGREVHEGRGPGEPDRRLDPKDTEAYDKARRFTTFLSTHPYDRDRAEIARKAAGDRADFERPLSAEEFAALKATCLGEKERKALNEIFDPPPEAHRKP